MNIFLVITELLFPISTFSYNFVPEHSRELAPETVAEGDLFGWSLSSWLDQIIVGSPGKDGKDGGIFMCYKYNKTPCIHLETNPNQIISKGMSGWMVASDLHDLYSCAPFAFLENYGKNISGRTSYITGACYSLNTNKMDLLTYFNMSRSGKPDKLGNRNMKNSKWYTASIIGMSGIVLERSLLLGTPLRKDKVNPSEKRKKEEGYSGSVIRVSKTSGSGVEVQDVDPGDVNYVVTEADLDSRVIHKMVGESVGSGQMFRGMTSPQVILGAPKADFLHGEVYVCGDCFPQGRGRASLSFPSGRNLKVTGPKLGERFGTSQAGCDVTGDGLDDLLVGAPLAARSQEEFDTGRVYVFLTKSVCPSSNCGSTLEKGSPPSVRPAGLSTGARFGAAIACIQDIDNDKFEDVIVGAPNQEGGGAAFIYYGSDGGLRIDREPQAIVARGLAFQPQGFGRSLQSLTGSGRMVVVGAPLSNQVIMLQYRDVVRFTPKSRLVVTPEMIDLALFKEKEEQGEIPTSGGDEYNYDYKIGDKGLEKSSDVKKLNDNMEVEITISLLSPDARSNDLAVLLTWSLDDRLRALAPETEQVVVPAGQVTAVKRAFNLSALEPGYGVDMGSLQQFPPPIQVQAVLEWQIQQTQECLTPNPPVTCPMTDPLENNTHREFLRVQVPFKGGCSESGCKCLLQVASVKKDISLIVGEDLTLDIDQVTVLNVGTEFASKIELLIDSHSEGLIPVEVSSQRAGAQQFFCTLLQGEKTARRFSCPLLATKDRAQYNISFKIAGNLLPSTGPVPVSLSVEHTCVDQYMPTTLAMNVNLLFPVTSLALSDLSNSYVVLKGQNRTISFSHSYRVTTGGNLLSTKLGIQITIKMNDLPLSESKVDITGCTAEGVVESCEDQEKCLHYNCSMEGMEGKQGKVVRINMEVQDSPLLDFEQLGKMVIQTSLKVPSLLDKNRTVVEYRSLSFATRFAHRSFMQKLINYWYVAVGIIVGLIIIIIVVLIFKRLGVFNKVRYYREEMKAIHGEGDTPLREEQEDQGTVVRGDLGQVIGTVKEVEMQTMGQDNFGSVDLSE